MVSLVKISAGLVKLIVLKISLLLKIPLRTSVFQLALMVILHEMILSAACLLVHMDHMLTTILVNACYSVQELYLSMLIPQPCYV